jgi:hypothetical protein
MQVSHKLTAPDNPALEYYTEVYKECQGYHMPEHFMEIPTWIPMIAGMLSDSDYEKELHVVTSVEETVEWATTLPQSAIILMSVMEVNFKVVHALLQSIPRKFILGGYVDPEQFEQYHHALWLSDVKDVECTFPFGVDAKAPPDYTLFKNLSVIPRITLSEGCLYDCAFCTIERSIIERSWEDVEGQLDALHQLKFELVYLDDKTYGQADNWKWLGKIGKMIKMINPQFRGFIVQTTVPMMLKHLYDWVYDQDVAYVEVGVEHVDEGYLRRMKKPYAVNQLEDLSALIRDFNMNNDGVRVGFIPNIMFALPEADYGSTVKWVERNKDIIDFVNPFILCQYGTSKGALVEEAEGAHDQDENSLVKSWLTSKEVEETSAAMQEILHLTRG